MVGLVGWLVVQVLGAVSCSTRRQLLLEYCWIASCLLMLVVELLLTASGSTLSADCRNTHGAYVHSSLNLNKCIANDNGVLHKRCNGKKAAMLLTVRYCRALSECFTNHYYYIYVYFLTCFFGEYFSLINL